MTLTAERFRELFDYDRDTGLFSRRVKTSNRSVMGPTAGTPSNRYLVLYVDGRMRYCHRLAWLHAHGEWPRYHIDHLNGNTRDNRLCNLRDVPTAINLQNQHVPKSHNKSGTLGVGVKADGRYRARIGVNGVQLHLGTFATKDEAAAAYLEAKQRLHR